MCNGMHNSDTTVIYPSVNDGCWVAHSLRTDQIGIGKSPFEALVNLIQALCLLTEDSDDKTLKIFRDAPPEIQEMVNHAEKMTYEVYEIAYKRVHGEWPPTIEPDFKFTEGYSYTTELQREDTGMVQT